MDTFSFFLDGISRPQDRWLCIHLFKKMTISKVTVHFHSCQQNMRVLVASHLVLALFYFSRSRGYVVVSQGGLICISVMTNEQIFHVFEPVFCPF